VIRSSSFIAPPKRLLPTIISAMPPGTAATLVLEGTYEETLRAALLDAARSASYLMFLTRAGGGARLNRTA